MKYLLFAGNNYYPIGGLDDLKGTFDSKEEAWSHLNNITRSAPYHTEIQWFQIVLMDDSGLTIIKDSKGYKATAEGWCDA